MLRATLEAYPLSRPHGWDRIHHTIKRAKTDGAENNKHPRTGCRLVDKSIIPRRALTTHAKPITASATIIRAKSVYGPAASISFDSIRDPWTPTSQAQPTLQRLDVRLCREEMARQPADLNSGASA